MYKVSFADDFKKVERFNNKVTKVTLKGKINDVFDEGLCIPSNIINWMENNSSEIKLDYIKVSGVSVKNDKDTYDPILGERLAEARAKLKIYKYMKTFCCKMLQYYAAKVFGITDAKSFTVDKVIMDCNNSLIEAYKKYCHLIEVENTHIKQLLYDY